MVELDDLVNLLNQIFTFLLCTSLALLGLSKCHLASTQSSFWYEFLYFICLRFFFSFAMFGEVTEHLCTDGSRIGILVIPVTYFVLTQEIVFLLWLLPSEELWISRGYEVCAAATMEPDGHQAGIFHLAFCLQEMIFPGMMHNL